MPEKSILFIVAVSFFVLETALWGLDKAYLEPPRLPNGQTRLALPPNGLASLLLAVSPAPPTLLWNYGSEKADFPIKDLVIPFQRSFTGREDWQINTKKLRSFLNTLSARIDRAPVDAKLLFSKKERKAKELSPSQDGYNLNVEASLGQIRRGVAHGESSIELIVKHTTPAITTKRIDSLGITNLLAEGQSNFHGSSPSRIHNIKTGASQFQGVLVGPGEEFSFNKTLGEVDQSSGYQSELIIKNKKIIPEYGGGICQVSTTLFRAALLAGLPIIERRGHSLPVKYYSPQGFDATIYPGVVDLRFRNDTLGYLLIQNRIEKDRVIFEIYGSEDGRQVEIKGPLAYEQKTDGSLKTVLIRKITPRQGQTKEEKFWTIYKSPQLFPLVRNPLE